MVAEIWPNNAVAWRMFLEGGGAACELRDYLVPCSPANRTMCNHLTRNHLPRLYSKPGMMKGVWKYLYKLRDADLNQTMGRLHYRWRNPLINGGATWPDGDAVAEAEPAVSLISLVLYSRRRNVEGS